MWPFRRRGRLPSALSSGNVVTIALELYRHQGNRYFLLSLFAHAWFFLLTIAAVLIVAVALIVGGILAGAMDNVAPFLWLTGISILVALPLYLFGWTRLMASGALLSRRIYAVLTALEESESAARSFIFPKMLNYLLATLMVGVILLLVYGVLGAIGYLIYLVASPLVQFLEQNIQTEPARSLFFLTFLLSILLLVLLALLVISYFMARLSLVDVVLALEPGLYAPQIRSAQLATDAGTGMAYPNGIFCCFPCNDSRQSPWQYYQQRGDYSRCWPLCRGFTPAPLARDQGSSVLGSASPQ